MTITEQKYELLNINCMHIEYCNNPATIPVRGDLYVPRLNFKPFHVAISEGSHVAVGISSKATDIDIGNV